MERSHQDAKLPARQPPPSLRSLLLPAVISINILVWTVSWKEAAGSSAWISQAEWDSQGTKDIQISQVWAESQVCLAGAELQRFPGIPSTSLSLSHTHTHIHSHTLKHKISPLSLRSQLHKNIMENIKPHWKTHGDSHLVPCITWAVWVICLLKTVMIGCSLMAQWLRIHLPMQWIWVQSLAWGIKIP